MARSKNKHTGFKGGKFRGSDSMPDGHISSLLHWKSKDYPEITDGATFMRLLDEAVARKNKHYLRMLESRVVTKWFYDEKLLARYQTQSRLANQILKQ